MNRGTAMGSMAGFSATPKVTSPRRPVLLGQPARGRSIPSPHDAGNALPVLGEAANRAGYGQILVERWSVCWLTSAIVNLVVLLTAAVALVPVAGRTRAIALTAQVAVEEDDFDALSMPADTEPIQWGVALERPSLQVLEPQEVRVDLSQAGSLFVDVPGGWQAGTESAAGGGAEYFGTLAYGNRFVYILDKSSSMNGGRSGIARPDSRFDRARYELLRSVDRLAEHQSFYVILFSTGTRCMFDSPTVSPVPRPATRENKRRLRKWLEGVKVGGATDPREALFLALEMAPDAVFLLSDGEFNSYAGNKRRLFTGRPEAEQLVERINHARTPIHTFAYEDPSSKRRMQNLARITGGQYKFIPAAEQPEPPQQTQGVE